jgi:hypothetical protein
LSNLFNHEKIGNRQFLIYLLNTSIINHNILVKCILPKTSTETTAYIGKASSQKFRIEIRKSQTST